jgi:GNAT superfamily N-acetyltransferase
MADRVEHVEAEAWAELQLAISPELRSRFGIEVWRPDGGVALVARHLDVLAINRVLGLGFDSPLTPTQLDDIVASYRAAGVARLLFQWSPEAQPAEAAQWLTARGFRPLPRMVKLRRHTGNGVPAAVPTTLSVVEIGAGWADVYETTVAAELGVPADISAGIRSTLGRPAWHYYLALDGERPVAGAALFVRDDFAWCGLAATLPGDRRRGAQSALLVRRLRDAAALGCTWVTCDTLEETAERPNPSLRNMRRLGFEIDYLRPSYLLDLRASSAANAG